MRTLLLLLLSLPALADGKGTIRGQVTAEGGRPWVVYLEKAEPATPPAARLKIEQKNTRFVPEALVAIVGQTIDFPNLDKFYHNVFSVTPGNEFDLGLYRSGVSKSAQLTQPGELTIYCNIHPEMVAQVLVLQNAHYAEVAADGSYTLADVTPGSYTVVAWSGKHEPVKQTVEVKAGAAAKANFTLKLRKAGAHLNKNGEQYGRYK
jgi:plastocyanin